MVKHNRGIRITPNTANVRITPNISSVKYSEATAKRFIEDAIFLYEKATESNAEQDKKRFSRIAITLIPYYLESLSNYLYYSFTNAKIDDVDKRTDLQKPIRMFRFVYQESTHKELEDKDINGIRDIFLIRNKISAHPAGRSNLISAQNGWEREDKNIPYYKYTNLPKVYSHFYPEHVYLLFNEVHDFLTKYISSIKNKLSEKQYNYVWPQDLISLISKS
jgi:hypothetical protein